MRLLPSIRHSRKVWASLKTKKKEKNHQSQNSIIKHIYTLLSTYTLGNITDHLILRNSPGLRWDRGNFLPSSWYRAVFWVENENKCSVYKLGGKLARCHCLGTAWASVNKWWATALSITCFAYSSSIIIISFFSFLLNSLYLNSLSLLLFFQFSSPSTAFLFHFLNVLFL